MLLLIAENRSFYLFRADFNDEKCFLTNNVPPLGLFLFILFMDHKKGPKYLMKT